MSSITYVGRTSHSGPIAGTDTFTGAAIGSAASDRKVIIVWNAIQNGGVAVAAPACDVGGNAATRRAVAQPSGNDANGNRPSLAIFEIDIASGTTANIVMSGFNGATFFDSQIAVYTCTNVGAFLDSAAAASLNLSSDDPVAVNVDTEDGGAVFSGLIYYSYSSPTHAWAGVSEDDTNSVYGDDTRAVASLETSADESPRTVTISHTSGGGGSGQAYCVAAVSFAAGAGGGSQTANPTAVDLTISFGAPTVTLATHLSVSPVVLEQAISFGAPDVTHATPLSVIPAVLDMLVSIPSPTVTDAQLVVNPALLELLVSFGSPTFPAQALSVHPEVLAQAISFGAPTVTDQILLVQPSCLALVVSYGDPTVTNVTPQTVLPEALSLAIHLNAPVVTVGQQVFPLRLLVEIAFGDPSVTGGAAIVARAILRDVLRAVLRDTTRLL